MVLSERQYSFRYPVYQGEFWTSKQRQMHPIHYTVSYRASFKPELPEFFIKKYLTGKNQVVMDPFAGRGTTILQANLMGYRSIHNDLSPVSLFISSARQYIPNQEEFLKRIEKINFHKKRVEPKQEEKEKFFPFFHPETYKEILNLREEYLANQDDKVLKYIMLIALSRLHGHSNGFFSVYSFPQFSVSPDAQRKNNIKRNIKPIYKDIKSRIIRKFKQDHKIDIPDCYRISRWNEYYQMDSRNLYLVPDHYVDLIVTSPPFLDKVNYKQDNWLRAWFIGVEEELKDLSLGIYRNLEEWKTFMYLSLKEMIRVLKPMGRIVIEVGEVKYSKKTVFLEEVLSEIVQEYFHNVYVEEVFLNIQNFTKLSNCWKIDNNQKGTNTNRCIVIRKMFYPENLEPSISIWNPSKKIKLLRNYISI